jgi:hypothetical protein
VDQASVVLVLTKLPPEIGCAQIDSTAC